MPEQRQSGMRTRLSLLAALTTLVLAGSACTDDGSDDVARDPVSSSPASSGPPAPAVPEGPVRTRDLATVMDTGSPELCLGPIAESYPPQCGGPALLDWDWAEHEGTFDQQGDIRWGTYARHRHAGTARPSPPPRRSPARSTTLRCRRPRRPRLRRRTIRRAELEQIATELAGRSPAVLGAYGGEGSDGHVLVDVYYDDGSLQEWADATYGAVVVLVSSALVDAD